MCFLACVCSCCRRFSLTLQCDGVTDWVYAFVHLIFIARESLHTWFHLQLLPHPQLPAATREKRGCCHAPILLPQLYSWLPRQNLKVHKNSTQMVCTRFAICPIKRLIHLDVSYHPAATFCRKVLPLFCTTTVCQCAPWKTWLSTCLMELSWWWGRWFCR